MTHFRIPTPLRWGALIFLLFLAACAGAPVQEMSNARQSVAAAQQAGAAVTTPLVLAQAQKFMDDAQAALDAGDYATARKDAQRAQEAALRALQISRKQGSSGTSGR